MSLGNRFLFKNGGVSHAVNTPQVAALLESHSGAYTTTRSLNNGSQLLFWERHMQRLSNSVQLLLKSNPDLLFGEPISTNASFSKLLQGRIVWDSVIRSLVHKSMSKVVPFVLQEGKYREELAITILVSGKNQCIIEGSFDDGSIQEVLDVYTHIGGYVPSCFGVSGNAARLAVVGHGREYANVKYSSWIRLRKPLEKMRPPSVTELLLSNDGDQLLEGCVTNFFVVCLKEKDGESENSEQSGLETFRSIEVQTAPLSNGVLPGVIRQVIRDICLKLGIPFREIAPSWSHRELWTEAFITSSLRVIQHVESIQAPTCWNSADSKSWEDIIWVEKQFKKTPGRIASMLQKMILEQASIEAFPIASFAKGCL